MLRWLAVVTALACSPGEAEGPGAEPRGDAEDSAASADSASNADSASTADSEDSAPVDSAEPIALPALYINEFVAANAQSALDEAGQAGDWIELYNAGEERVALAGYGMTDDLDDPLKHVLGDLEIPAGGFLLLWADDQALPSPTHLGFSLDRDGEEIGLFHPLGIPIDQLDFQPQATDIAAARQPDGGPGWSYVYNGTPGQTNTVPSTVEQTLIEAGSTWSYLDAGVQPASGWTDPGFDRSAWPSGPAPLGYGDAHQVTVVDYGGDPNNKHITTWFAHEFEASEVGGVLTIELDLLCDDGAVVYLNGAEVARPNLPAPSDASTLASAAIGGADETAYIPYEIDLGVLVEGANVLAVEVHQAAPTSSDLGLDAELRVSRLES